MIIKSIFSYMASFLPDIRPVLTRQQKRISEIATAAFSFLATSCNKLYRCFVAKPVNNDPLKLKPVQPNLAKNSNGQKIFKSFEGKIPNMDLENEQEEDFEPSSESIKIQDMALKEHEKQSKEFIENLLKKSQATWIVSLIDNRYFLSIKRANNTIDHQAFCNSNQHMVKKLEEVNKTQNLNLLDENLLNINQDPNSLQIDHVFSISSKQAREIIEAGENQTAWLIRQENKQFFICGKTENNPWFEEFLTKHFHRIAAPLNKTSNSIGIVLSKETHIACEDMLPESIFYTLKRPGALEILGKHENKPAWLIRWEGSGPTKGYILCWHTGNEFYQHSLGEDSAKIGEELTKVSTKNNDLILSKDNFVSEKIWKSRIDDHVLRF